MKKAYSLNSNWKFTALTKNDIKKALKGTIRYGQWLNANVPGTIHTDLLNAGVIPEPFYADNENSLQWIGQADWTYKTSFDMPKDFNPAKTIQLVFEGLDTAAEIILNDVKIGSVNNMFLKNIYEVKELLKKRNNKLVVNFTSPEKYAKDQERQFGKLPVALRSERVYIRKAQYSFGWDWGPAFITMGIWRSVYLQQPDEYQINDFTFETLSIDNSSASLKIKFGTGMPLQEGIKVKILLGGTEIAFESEEIITAKTGLFEKEFKINNPRLWFPNGFGEPYLYNLEIQLLKDDIIIDSLRKKVGIRTVKLQLEEEGKPTFRFIVNGEPLFLKGANWIPADTFLPRVSNEKYHWLIKKAKEANMNVLRVWGGGTYENDIFYELCDEMGILVWQDFMFACAAYPEHEAFMTSVSQEVEQNISRLQYHACLAIWCGNNENEWIWYQEINKNYKNMPGYKIYHDLIPEILNKLDPGRPYWPSSPFSDEEDPNSVLSGNRHQWDLWSRWVDYKKVKQDESLFVTEFGFQAPANVETMISVLPKNERFPQSCVFEFHNKQVEGPERLLKFLASHLPVNMGFEDFIYLTQLNQALALRECVEHWQSRFPKTNGSIIWQINDCWPVSSWAMIDSFLLPKLSYYFVKKSFSNQFLTFDVNEREISVLAFNNSRSAFTGACEIDIIHLKEPGKIKLHKSKKTEIDKYLPQVVFSIPCSDELRSGKSILVITLKDMNNNTIYRNLYTGIELKYISISKPKINIKESREELIISSDKLALFVELTGKNLLFEDNGFIILPGEKIKLNYSYKAGKRNAGSIITSKTLNDYLH